MHARVCLRGRGWPSEMQPAGWPRANQLAPTIWLAPCLPEEVSRSTLKHFLLLLVLAAAAHLPATSATSNLNSIWLTPDTQDLQQHQQLTPVASFRSAQHVALHEPGPRLQAAPSSLQPTVASPPREPQELERRSGEPTTTTGSGESPDLNQTTNAQVQFDEEHQPAASSRRQDGDTMRPSVLQVEERNSSPLSQANGSTQPTPVSPSSTQRPAATNQTGAQQPFIYYLSDGDKWNQPSDKTTTYEPPAAVAQPSTPRYTGNQQQSKSAQGDADIVSYLGQEYPQEPGAQPAPQPWPADQELTRYSTPPPPPPPLFNRQPTLMQARPPVQTPRIVYSNLAPTNLELPLFAQLDPPKLKHLLGPRYLFDAPPRYHTPRAPQNFRLRAQNRSPSKPRKSFFEILGSRINSWVEAGQDGRGASLDEEFWGEPQVRPSAKPRRRIRSPRPKVTLHAAEPSVVQAVYLQPSNQLYYQPSAAGAGGSAELLVAQPALAYLSPVRQPQVAYPPRSLADKFYGDPGSGRASRLSSRPNFLASGHFGDFASGNHLRERSHQQPAGFLPVVAVSVTRTSPAPRPATAAASFTAGSRPSADLNPELLEYLEMKTGSGSAMEASSGSPSYNNNQQHLKSPPISALDSQDAHTTTVKSAAVFGYYPHEAQRPLLQAIGVLPSNQHSGSGELEASKPMLHPNYLTGVDDSPAPSLLLQLQASNFAQNDIAYPFGPPLEGPTSGGGPAYLAAASASGAYSPYRPSVDVYPMNRHQFPAAAAYQLIQGPPEGHHFGAQLTGASSGATRPSGAGQQQQQLLSVAGTDMSPLLAAHNGPLLVAAAASRRPLTGGGGGGTGMPSAQAMAAMDDYHQQHYSAAATGPDDNESEQSVQSATDAESTPSSGELGGRHHQVKKRGKKRSSEFFASAGQLLLSALPLLLAPTLGLMFGAGPLPAARYQAAPGGGSAATNFGAGSLHSSAGIPGNYIGSFTSTPGHVHNASPAQLFTPAPQSYSTSSSPAPAPFNAGAAAAASTTSTASPRVASRAPLPAPLVVGTVHRVPAAAAAGARPTPSPSSLLLLQARNQSNAPPAPQRLVVTLTTGGPERRPEVGNVSAADEQPHHFQGHAGRHTSAAGAVLMLPGGAADVGETPAAVNSSLRAPQSASGAHYDGYDGVDFDAQFADLEGPGRGNSSAKVELALNNSTTNDQARLYPVSTWPPLRRRTVSLVTSSGNRTYASLEPMGDQSLELYEPMNQAGAYSVSRVKRARRQAPPEAAPADKEAPPTPPIKPTVHRPRRRLKRIPGKTRLVVVKRRRLVGGARQPEEMLASADSRNKAAHIFTTIMAQVGDEPSVDDQHSIQGSAARPAPDLRHQLWNEELANNPAHSEPEVDDEHDAAAPVVRSRLAARDKGAGAGRWSMSGSAAAFEGPHSVEVEPNGSEPSIQLGRGRGYVPPTPLQSQYNAAGPRASGSRKASSSSSRTNEPQRIYITDDTKQALMNFNSLLIKDTLANSMPPPRSQAKLARRSTAPKRSQQVFSAQQQDPQPVAALDTHNPTGHLWRPRSQEPEVAESFSRDAESSALGDELSGGIPLNASYKGVVDQVNLVDNDSEGYLYEQRARQRPAAGNSGALDYYEPRLHGDLDPVEPPAGRPQADLNTSWRLNSSADATSALPVECVKPTRRRHLPAQPASTGSGSILYDLLLRNRSQPVLDGSPSHNVFSPVDAELRRHPTAPPPPPPLAPYSQHQHHNQVPSNFAGGQSQDFRSHRYPQEYSSGSRHQHEHSQLAGYLAQQQQQADYLPDHQHWTSQPLDGSASGEQPRRGQFNDSDRDKLMASYLTCDGLLNDADHCLERLSCEFSDPRNIEQANKLDRAVSSILLGHILINTYIPDQFKQRLKSASLFGYMRRGSCSRFACQRLANRQLQQQQYQLHQQQQPFT